MKAPGVCTGGAADRPRAADLCGGAEHMVFKGFFASEGPEAAFRRHLQVAVSLTWGLA